METFRHLMQSLAEGLGPYAPRLVGALAILVVAWIGALVAQGALLRVGAKARLDERLHHPGMSALLGNIARYAVWLFALPALLGTLELKGLLDPVNAMLSRMLGFLPNLFGAAVILGVGILVAGIVRQIVTGLLQAAGSEKVAAQLGMSQALGKNSLAGIAGSVLFTLLLLPTLAAALEALGLASVSKPVGQLLDKVFDMIPRVISAAIILGVAALIGRALASAAGGVLAGMGFNTLPAKLGLSGNVRAGGREPSELAGTVVMVAVMFVALTQACEVIGLPVLTDVVATVGLVLARVAVAALLLLVGLWLATLAARMIESSAARNAPVLASLARGAILFFAAALALRQAGLPSEIVTIAFAAVVGAIAVGVAVAVGMGGRHVAGRLLERAAQSFDDPKPHDDQPLDR
ncbi:MAG: mechanosensitive ion channel [Ideonella sp.]|nr:mechanosensitive ion channel [Ideonella sp.]